MRSSQGSLHDSYIYISFAVDVSSYNCKVKNEQTTDVAVTEIPKNNPVSLMLQKGDKETGKAEPQGGAKLEGAVYEIKYYKHKDGSTSLDRTWRVVTDDEGKANLSEEYLDKSFENSQFYLDSKGSICLPLGTVTIQEVKAPEGYLLNDKIYTDEIAEGNETVETVSTSMLLLSVRMKRWLSRLSAETSSL